MHGPSGRTHPPSTYHTTVQRNPHAAYATPHCNGLTQPIHGVRTSTYKQGWPQQGDTKSTGTEDKNTRRTKDGKPKSLVGLFHNHLVRLGNLCNTVPDGCLDTAGADRSRRTPTAVRFATSVSCCYVKRIFGRQTSEQ